MVQVAAFKWVPPFAQGSVRDIRVRWALEESGVAYEPMLIDFDDAASPEYRALQPFGQVPAYRDDGIEMFESCAIVLHISRRFGVLAPLDETGRDRVTCWLFAASNSIEPYVAQLADIDLFSAKEAWAIERRPQVETQLRQKLADLQTALGDKDWFADDRFSAADIIMTHVLRDLRHTDILADYPKLAAFVKRAEARPAFQKALADQLAPFKEAEKAMAAA